MLENNRIEFKRKLTEDLEKEVIAFLNSSGGVIYIGKDNNGKIYLINNTDAVQLKIKDKLKHNISPSILGLFDIIEENGIIKIIIAKGNERPYYITKKGMSSKGCYIRVGSASEPMRTTMIEDLFSRRTRNSLSKILSPNQDLTFEQLKIYYEERKLKLNKNFIKNLNFLTDNNKYNYISYLLADNNTISIKVAKYAGKDRVDLIENIEFGFCCIVKATKSILDKLNVENRILTEITAKERVERPLWNKIAVREAVINAIIHNDYTNEIPPKFEIFEDRLEITSAGNLPLGMSKEEFFEGVSNPRNKDLMRVFRDLELVEQLGSGIPRILQFYSKDSFIFMEHFTRNVFRIGGAIGGAIGGVIGDIIHLTDRQKEILNLIRKDNQVSYRKIAKILNIAESAVSKHIKKLKQKGVLKRVGRTRGYWVVSNEIKDL